VVEHRTTASAPWEALKDAWREADRAVVEDRNKRAFLARLASDPSHTIPANPPDVRIDQPHDLHQRQHDALRVIAREHQDDPR
jgi:hypothetical protein